MISQVDFGNLKIQIEEKTDEAIYTFVGDVDEHFRQKDVPRVKKQTITLVLEEINNFNSCGIREWIYLIRDLGELGHIVFKKCSITMIDQINLVPDSLGKGHVESFFAPYFCECGGETNRLINVAEHMHTIEQKQAPEFNCDDCGKALEFDALEESYFLFVESGISKAS